MARKAAKKAASPTSVIYPAGCEPIDPDTNNSSLVLAFKSLYERLCEDETATEDNFESLATHLVSTQLLNKPADVSVYVALCLARIFCICPTNPFELRNEELREALDFLAKSIGRIRCENEALFTKHHSLLEMVSNHSILQHNLKQLDPETDDGARVVATLLKSAALVVEVRKAADRVQDERNEQVIERTTGVRTMIHNICRGVLEENADHIHPIALDVIFSHLISPEKVNNPEAYHLMRKLCEHGTVYIHPRILSILVQACQTQEDPKLDTEHFKLVGKRRAAVYELLSELSDVLPDIRNDLLSLLSAKLASSDVEVRLLAMKTAAEVAKNRGDLAESCESLWTRFVLLSRDPSPLVRREIAVRVKDLLYSNHDMRSTIWDFLVRLVVDSDEEVRMATIETVCLTARNKLEAVNEKLIECCTERLRDKKADVRKCALKHLLNLYKDVVRREESTKSDRASVAIIAKKTIQHYKSNTWNTGMMMTEEKVIIEKGLISSLLPKELPMRRRMELLVEMSTRLTAGEIKILHEMLARVVGGRRLLSSIMDCISVRKEGDAKERSQEDKKKITEQCIEKLVKFFPHAHKAESTLRKFVNLLCVDNEAVRQMEIILRKETTVIEADNAVKRLLGRLGSGRDDMNKEQEEMIRSLLSRLAPLLIDHTSLLELSRYMRDIIDGESIGKEEASRIINRAASIYKVLGELYPSNLNQREIIHILLSKFLESNNEFVVKCGLQCIRAMLAKEAGVDGMNVKEEKWREGMKETLLALMKEGSPSCAKHAFRDICHLLGKEETWHLLQGYMEGLMDNLGDSQESTARALVILRKAVPAWQNLLLEKIQAIYPIEIARKILVPDPLTYDGGETVGVNASEMKTMEEIPVSVSMKNTLCAIKLAVRVLPLFPRGEHSDALIQKTINVLSVCAQEKGMVADNITESDAAWLTALSGSALVRLMTNRRLSTNANFFKPSLMTALAQVATHPLEAVRTYLLNRLYKYYRALTLPLVILTSPFLSLIPLSLMAIEKGVDTEEEEKRNRQRVFDIFVQCVQCRYQSLLAVNMEKDVLVKNELFIPHLVSLLAESPRLCNSRDEEELTKIAEVLWHCVEAMSTRVRGCLNWDLVCALLNQLKTVSPKMEEDDDSLELAEKVWAISEVLLHLIVYKAKIATTNSEKNAPLLRSFYVPRKGGNSRVYAPTALLKRIEEGKIQYEFNRLKISSTMSKEESKKEHKGRGRRKVVRKKEESEEEIDDEEEEEAMMPSTSRRGQKVMETVEEENEDEDMEMEEEKEKEEKKMRGRGHERMKMPPVNRRLTSMRELESIDLSPIVKTGGATRRVGGLAVSTPIVKNGMDVGGAKAEKEADTTPTKRGKGRLPSSSPVKLPSQSASSSPLSSPVKSPPTIGRQNGTRKRSSKKEEEEDEEKDEDDTPPAKRGRGRAAAKKENGKEEAKKKGSSATNSRKGRGKKKVEDESEDEKDDSQKEEEEEREEEEVYKPLQTRRGRIPSTKLAGPSVVKKKKK